MTAQGIVLNLSQISFQIHAQQASSDPGYKVSNRGKAEWKSRKARFLSGFTVINYNRKEYDADKWN